MRGLSILLLLLFLGCPPADRDDVDPALPEDVETPDPEDVTDDERARRMDEVMQEGRGLGESASAIEDRFGAPSDVVRTDTTNPHTGARDEIIRLEYPGLTFELYRVTEDPRDLLMKSVVADPETSQGLQFPIGTPMGAVRANLGEPVRERSPEDDVVVLTYETMGIGPEEYVTFHFREGRLEKMEWDYYVD